MRRPPSSGRATTTRSAPDSSCTWAVIAASTCRGSVPDSRLVATSPLACSQRCWRCASSYSRAFSSASDPPVASDTPAACGPLSTGKR